MQSPHENEEQSQCITDTTTNNNQEETKTNSDMVIGVNHKNIKLKAKPKKNFIEPSPMILCNNNFGNIDKDRIDLDNLHNEDNDCIPEEEEKEREADMNNEISFGLQGDELHQSKSMFQKRQSKKKKSRDDNDLLKPKGSKHIITHEIIEDNSSDAEPNLVSRHTINVSPGQTAIGYSILNYLEKTCNEKEKMKESSEIGNRANTFIGEPSKTKKKTIDCLIF